MVPKVCAMHFSTQEAANLFQLQCLYEGNRILAVYRDSGGWVVRYSEERARVNTITVEQLITKNGIEDFNLTFLNGLGQKIENPNANLIAGMRVKAAEIDWLCQSAKITVITV